MKYKILFLFLIVNNHFLFSQFSFDNVYSNDWTTSGWQLAIDNDNNYYIPFYHTHEEGDYETWGGILKLNEAGQTIDSVYIEQTIGYNCYQNGPRITIISDTLYCFGNRFSNSDAANTSFHATKLDLDLNIISTVEIPYPDQFRLFPPRSIEYYNDNFVLLCNYFDENSNLAPSLSSGIFMMEIDRNFTDYNFAFQQDDDFFTHSLDFVKRPSGDYLIATINGWYNNDIHLGVPFVVFNSDFTPELTYGITNVSAPYSKIDIDLYQDSLYLYAGNTSYNNSSNVSVYKVDQDFDVIDSVLIYTQPGEVDTINKACTQCLDQFDDDNIYFASNRNVVIPNVLQNFPNYIRLVKLDGDLNIVWEKFYGGERANYVNGVTATPDGGCIMLCNYYDNVSYPSSYHRSLRVIKVDGDGLITGITKDSELQIKSLLIYPNPTNGIIQIETALNKYKLFFFSANGTVVLKTNTLNGNQSLDMSSLTNGTYHYSVINEMGMKVDGGSIILAK